MSAHEPAQGPLDLVDTAQHDRMHLYRGDNRAVLATLPAASVDLICTSPPYNCRVNYGAVSDELPWPEYYATLEQVLRECYRLLVPGGTLAIVVPGVIGWQPKHAYNHTWADYDPTYRWKHQGVVTQGKGRAEPLGFRLQEMMRALDPHLREPIIWVKGEAAINPHYAMGCDSDPRARPAHEMILLGSKGRWFHRGGTGRRGQEAVPWLDDCKDIWIIPAVSHRRHPAVFPVEIPRRLLRLLVHAPDAVVLDPYMGVGTTGVAALESGLTFIGIEQDPAYYRVAELALLAQPRLFTVQTRPRPATLPSTRTQARAPGLFDEDDDEEIGPDDSATEDEEEEEEDAP